jgi:SWIM/SEC-C metal-binding protein
VNIDTAHIDPGKPWQNGLGERVGTEKRPAILRVKTEKRAAEVTELCARDGIHYILGIEPEQPEDISDIDLALNPPEPIRAAPKIGRNDPCHCGSSQKLLVSSKRESSRYAVGLSKLCAMSGGPRTVCALDRW